MTPQGKIPTAKAGIGAGSAVLEEDVLTTRPTRLVLILKAVQGGMVTPTLTSMTTCLTTEDNHSELRVARVVAQSKLAK